jgi:hypothetical protein
MYTHTYLHGYRAVSIVVLSMLGAAPRVAGQVGLGLVPMRLEMKLSGGQQQSGVLNLTNDSAGRVRIRAEVLDFYVDDNATPQFVRSAPGAAYSCQSWLTLNPMEMEVDSKAQALVRYTIKAPAGSPERGYHCAAAFTTLPTAGDLSQTGIKTAVRIVSAFYVVLGNPSVEGGFKEIRLERTSDPKEPWRAVVVLKNFSDMHFRPSGELSLLDDAGKVVESNPFVPLPVLPKREQPFLFPLKAALAPGNYTLRARVDMGSSDLQEGTAMVTVLPQPKP